jgi:hypothetical protein
MTDPLQSLLDKQSIYEVLITYCRGVDRCDEALVRSVYHEDSFDDHGYWRGSGADFAPFVTGRLAAANSATTHSITNVLIELDGDSAWSESQVLATLVRKDSQPPRADVMGARYLDHLSRRDGVWRIDDRTVVLDWHKTEVWSGEAPPVPTEGFARGGRYPEDPVYVRTGPGQALRR